MKLKRSTIVTLCVITAAFNCIDLSSEKGDFKTNYGGIAWIGTDSLLYLSQEHLGRHADLFVYEDSIIGTKLNIATVSNKLKALNSVDLLPLGKIIEGIKVYYPDRLIAYEDTAPEWLSAIPQTYFYTIVENKFDSMQYKNYRILNFTADGNILANIGRWDYRIGTTCGSDCDNYNFWSIYGYGSSVVMDKIGNVLSDSIPYTGVPSPVENILITPGFPIEIKTFPEDSTLYSIQDSSILNWISWSADGSKFIYVDTAQTVHLYSFSPAIAIVNSFPLDIRPDYARISPNGDYIAVNNKNKLIIYDRNGKQLGIKTL